MRMAEKKNTTEKILCPPGAVELPSGGWAMLREPSAATGADVQRVRKALNIDGDGDILTVAASTAIAVLLEDWAFPVHVFEQTPPFPTFANAGPMLAVLPGEDYMALEEAVMPWVGRVLGLRKKLTGPDPQ